MKIMVLALIGLRRLHKYIEFAINSIIVIMIFNSEGNDLVLYVFRYH